MPIPRLPPDKPKLLSSFKEVSTAVETLYKRRKEKLNIALEDRIADSLIPSNLDASIAADNLKVELSGKYKKRKVLNLSTLAKDKMKNVDKNLCDTSLDKSREAVSSSNYETSHQKSEVSEEFTVQLRKACTLPPLPPIDEVTKPPSIDLVQEVEKLLALSSSWKKSKICFDVSPRDAFLNYALLLKNGFDLHKLLNEKKNPSITNYGSEFKPVESLEPLLHLHPRWPKLKHILKNGSDWKMKAITEIKRKEDLENAISRGNHKSAEKNLKFLSEALLKEIRKGWVLPLPLEKAEKIPGLVISPLGVAEQLGISAEGNFVPKRRITHDLSFPGTSSEESVNSRVISDDLEPCMFGYTMLRIIHRLVHLRAIHPFKKIWVRKEDAKSAYRRMHLHANTTIKTGVQLEIDGFNYLLLSLRLPFGGSPCPSEFCLLSDIITDVINDLLKCEHWDPNTTRSDYIYKIPKAVGLPDSIPFAQAKNLSISIPEDDSCCADVFIDDIITIGVDIKNNLHKIAAAPSTIMHAIADSVSADTHVPRQDFIADDKNEAEGAPEEIKIVLGWQLNTRSLTVHLPSHKFIAWSEQVNSFIARKTANSKDLQSLLGRLEHVAVMIPMYAHFLNNIRALEIKATQSNRNQVINKRSKIDLKLSLKFLKKAHDGINMNLITFRSPSKVYINDASEHGLGGFACHGRAWSYTIPIKLRGRAHINLLEFLAQLVSIWIDKIEGKLNSLDCLLAMGDNTASMGWLRRSNFRENKEGDIEWLAKQRVARKVADTILESNTCLYRQWFKGEENVLADSLSRDGFIFSHAAHKTFVTQTINSQVPPNFNILPLPNEISCFISSTLQLLPVQKQRSKRQKASDLAHSNVGLASSLALESTTYFSKGSQDSNKTLLCQPLHNPLEKPPTLHQIKQNWWKERSVPPSHMWHRPSGQTIGQTQDWTLMVKSVSSYKSNSEDIAMRMADDEHRKHYQ